MSRIYIDNLKSLERAVASLANSVTEKGTKTLKINLSIVGLNK